MLSLSAFPADIPPELTVALSELVAFPDHLDPRLVYVLPQSVSVAVNEQRPDFFLLRYSDDFGSAEGGLLHLTLDSDPPPEAIFEAAERAGWRLRQVGFSAVRLRLVLRSVLAGEDDQTGVWRPALAAGAALRLPAVNLQPHEADLLLALLEDEPGVIEVEIEGRYAGLVTGLPWLATADAGRLWSHLAAMLPPEGARPDQVAVAFQSLPSEDASPVRWRALEPDAERPSDVVLQLETAWRSLETLFECLPQEDPFVAPHYRLLAQDALPASQLLWDLRPPRQEVRFCRLSWSLSQFFTGLSVETRAELFPIVRQTSPFQWVDVHVLNGLPFDPAFLQRALVDLRYTGPSGVPEFRTLTFDGKQDVQRQRAFFPALDGLNLAYRVTTVLAPPGGQGWPVIHRRDFVAAPEPVILLDRAAVGMDFVRLAAEPALFDRARSVEIALWPAAASPDDPPLLAISLDSSHLGAWAALPGIASADKLRVTAVAVAKRDGPRLTHGMRDEELANRDLELAAHELEPFDPTPIHLRLDPDMAGSFAYVAVVVAPPLGAERIFTLDPGLERLWHLFRPSVFDPVEYRYRIEYVAFDPQGETLPLTSTEWQTSTATELLVSPPLNEDLPA